MRISSFIRFVEDKALAMHAAAKPVVAAHAAAARQAHAAYKASLQPVPAPKAARKSTGTKRR